jgi:acyl dehydratase
VQTDVPIAVQGPYFEELTTGQRFETAPPVTITDGHATTHQSIVGDRMRLALDTELASRVMGRAPLAHPALVWDLAIGQSTLATHHVRANLFYRGLAFRRFPRVGDTLTTTTEVVGLRQNRPKPGRRPTGLAALRIRTVDQLHRPVLDFWRCAMLPLGDPGADTGRHDDLDAIGVSPSRPDYASAVHDWRLDRFREGVPGGAHFADIQPGDVYRVVGADLVSSAPELARLTLNIAMVHHDHIAAGGRRLVYGGHTIGIALAQACRALPNIVTVVGWEGCDHVGPVHEGDLLSSTVTVESTEPLPGDGGLVSLRIEVNAREHATEQPRPVLLWRCVVVMA